MFVWMAKFGAAYGVRTGIHVGVDVLINALNDRTSRLVRHLRPARRGALHRRSSARFGAHFVWELMHTDQVSADLELPEVDRLCLHPTGLVPDVLPLPAGGWSFHKTGHLPHADHGHVEGLDKDDAIEWASMPSDLHPADSQHQPEAAQ